jgi:hypothetical protein
MRHLAFVISLAACALLGCYKKAAAPGGTGPDPAPESTAVQPAKPLPPPPAFISARADNYVRQNVTGEVDAAMTRELRAFAQKKGRLPNSFAEFAKDGLDSIPSPPDGKKWVIDSSDLTVKAMASK